MINAQRYQANLNVTSSQGPSVRRQVVAGYRKGEFFYCKQFRESFNFYRNGNFKRVKIKNKKGEIEMLKKMKKVAAITTMLCLLGANTVLAAAPDPDAVITGGTNTIT